ncbi:MAG: hypothetical protein ACYCY5_06235 [Sulfuricella sp.]
MKRYLAQILSFRILLAALLLAPLWLPVDALALPSFARQTGFSCAECHAASGGRMSCRWALTA